MWLIEGIKQLLNGSFECKHIRKHAVGGGCIGYSNISTGDVSDECKKCRAFWENFQIRRYGKTIDGKTRVGWNNK